MRRALFLFLLFLAGCAASPLDGAIEDVDVVLQGEQHDAASHQRRHRELVEQLVGQGRLAAVVIEMADAGVSTRGLARSATEDEVKAALQWSEAGWPWRSYGPAVMAAVRAAIPVIGANVPRSQSRAAMQDATLDTVLPAAALKAQQDAVRAGHCGVLPESQIAPMTRVQLARDRSMAQTLLREVKPGKTVLLLAGNGHADPDLGVPRHLPAKLRVHIIQLPAEPQRDYCDDFRKERAP
ncbi:MAG: ChaN family lipoprotein [Ramlibacter sp.]|nr:ChaN family lipoprotein [Ramlibacter sp.]